MATLCVVCGAPAREPAATGPKPKRCEPCQEAWQRERNRAQQAKYRQDPDFREKQRQYLQVYGQLPHAQVKRLEWQRAYRATEQYRETAPWAHRQRRYGLTRDQIEAMYDRQCGSCALCMAPLKFDRMHVDHDHETGQVRGLLHPVCNLTLGRRYGDRY